ncbi:hypothetical protein BDZ90DRAFT_232867 [Jaminaea rosea]|uniref:GH16 domain-containing protein n=1 Tax=Jaminaea rosea TaxID=1569628 RepID=A0A316UNB3_9BASI|nr:hypothetical protein BDZ90DRAFT_232867 [Jaminaea rosea]PWN26750.1 hypothetical protein BDZ90DRAFT_232867 [Jaminaea rosea]
MPSHSPLTATAAAGLLATALFNSASASSWTLTDTYDANSFLQTSSWNYSTGTDPTHGLVVYQSADQAKQLNLTRVENDLFYMGVSTVEEQLAGRPSIRINSQKSYSDGIYVLNATHMPTSCAVWPAWWTVTKNLDSWPIGGEIDIIENANDQYDSNLASLHTNGSCILPEANNGTGIIAYQDCGDSSTGCRIEMNGTTGASASNTGPAFNKADGGIYAMERSLGSTGNGIRVWFWPQGSAPSDLASGSNSVNPANWGKPGAQFAIADECHADFGEHQITFDITLCGDWAGNTYEQTSCAKTYGACSAQVGYNGSSFNEAYWAVDSVRVFSTGGGTDNAANSANTASVSASSVSAENAKGGNGSSSGAMVAAVALPWSVAALVAVVSAWTLVA